MKTSRLADFDECRSPEEKAFALAILDRAEKGDRYDDLWSFADQLILSVCAFDAFDTIAPLLRTLRADFFGQRVVVGEDRTHQLDF